jgi:hypothetical protein
VSPHLGPVCAAHPTKPLIHGTGGRKAGCDDVDVQEVMEEARLRQVRYGVNATGAHRKFVN